jgi:hypothetical protein
MTPMFAAFLLTVLLELLVLCIVIRRFPPGRATPSLFPNSLELLRRAHDDKDRKRRRAEHEKYYEELKQNVEQ